MARLESEWPDHPVTWETRLELAGEPVVDVLEEPDCIRVIAELPGVSADAIRHELRGDVLTIRGGKTVEVVNADGHPLPHDGRSCGEVVFRAPWLTRAEVEAHLESRERLQE